MTRTACGQPFIALLSMVVFNPRSSAKISGKVFWFVLLVFPGARCVLCGEPHLSNLKRESTLMSDLVQLTKDNDIAIITINNPPVNALSPGVPEGIADSIAKINADAGVKAAVLIGGGKTFVAGARIQTIREDTLGQDEP